MSPTPRAAAIVVCRQPAHSASAGRDGVARRAAVAGATAGAAGGPDAGRDAGPDAVEEAPVDVPEPARTGRGASRRRASGALAHVGRPGPGRISC